MGKDNPNAKINLGLVQMNEELSGDERSQRKNVPPWLTPERGVKIHKDV